MIKNRLKIILNLSKIFLKDSYENINLINKKTNKINKKSIYLWIIIVLFFAIFFISQKVVKFLIDKDLSDIFLNFYFFILAILIIFQTSLVIINLFYFSKDLEYVLPLPIKPTDILISKFISLICRIYLFETIFGIIPVTIFGIYNNSSFLYYFYEIIIFVIFPIFLAAVVSIILMFFMKISRFIRNKDIFQIVLTFILITIMIIFQYVLLKDIVNDNIEMQNKSDVGSIENFAGANKIEEINKYFLVINPSVNILLKSNWSSLIDISKIIIIDLISMAIFIIIGKKTYLKDILVNTTYLKKEEINIGKLERKYKKRKKHKTYILKEIKTLYRNPILFIQCIFPSIALTVSISFMIIKLVPQFHIWLENEEFRNFIGDISFDITAIYVILGIMQFFFMISPTSLIAVSREGKHANYMKYLPISLYKQFVYKGIPQIIINFIPIVVLLIVIHIMIPEILLRYILSIFVLAILLNIINSYTMLIIDYLNPKTNWDTEYEILKQNKNKLFQYFFTVIIILLFVYLGDALQEINIEMAILITGIIFLIYIIILNIFVKIKNKKMYKKIF